MITLKTPVEQITSVGKTIASRLKYLGINTAEDLINYFPFRYDDFSNLKTISELKSGDIATVKGKIELLNNKRSPRKKMMITECFLTDSTGSIKAVWFRQPFITKTLKNGDEVYFSGKVNGDLLSLNFQSPSYEKVQTETTHTARLVPIYPTTDRLSQKQLRFVIKQALQALPEIEDWLPEDILKKYGLIGLRQALAKIHFPENTQDYQEASYRLKFDECLKLFLQNQLIKDELAQSTASSLNFNEDQTKEIVKALGFTLTDAQKKAAWQVLQDMTKDRPMNRLVEGDVGSGKTVVAALAIANAALNKAQSALLAPTEILANQHFESIKELLKPADLNVALLTRTKKLVYNTGDQTASKLSKDKLVKAIKSGEIKLVIGTHAILQETVEFDNLSLVVIDEQHRFGVKQRQTLREKSGNPQTTPHLLSMTATPIPRTLALTIYGDLNLSIIDELPPGRKKPITKLVEPDKRNRAYEFILEKIKEGRQAFVICPLIEESDKLGVKSATEEHQRLSETIFPQLKVGLLHGKLKPAEKEEVMAEFKKGNINILVATSVVEVGVNVPNASLMIIESAQRFGLSQLHQFRGRVNRSNHQAYCLLFTDKASEKSQGRLETLVSCFDGFKLAEEDLKQRGIGNLSGSQQSGWFNQFKIAKLTDVKILEQAKKASLEIADNFPEILKKIAAETSFHPE